MVNLVFCWYLFLSSKKVELGYYQVIKFKMNKKTIWTIVAIIVVILVVWGITNKPKDISGIKVGVIAPLTGALASYGEEVKKGVTAGSEGSPVQFIFEDGFCDPKTAITAFQKLTSIDNVKFIIGPTCGSPQEAVAPLLKDKQVLAIVPSSASNNLFETSDGLFFNKQYSLENESKFIADEMNRLGYKKVAIVTYGNAFSKTHHDSFVINFKGDIVVDTVLLDINNNLLTELTKIKNAGVDAIYSPDITFFYNNAIASMKQISLDVPIFSTSITGLPLARTLVEGVIYSYPTDIEGVNGGVAELSKIATEKLLSTLSACGNDVVCVQKRLVSSGDFDEFGTSKRGITLKQIMNGEVIDY